MTDNDEILSKLERIAVALEGLLAIYEAAERECPEAYHRNSTYYHDLIHIKVGHETLGLPFDPDLNREIDRVHHRTVEMAQSHAQQGGAFHEQFNRFRKEGRTKLR